MRAVLLAAGLVLITGPALAAPIPKVDVDGVCRDSASSSGKRDTRLPEERYQACFETNQAHYDRLKALWPTLSEEQQLRCTPSAHKDPYWGTYRDLRECAELVERARLRVQEEAEKRAAKERVQQGIPKQEFRY